MEYSQSVSSVHRILQARILEWVVATMTEVQLMDRHYCELPLLKPMRLRPVLQQQENPLPQKPAQGNQEQPAQRN